MVCGLGAALNPRAAILLAVLGLCRPGLAQQVSFVNEPRLGQPIFNQPGALLQPSVVEPVPIATVQPAEQPEAPGDRRFWDRENSFLFAASAAFSAADFVVTRDNLRSGGQELNPITRVFCGSTAGLAMNFAGETAGVVGLSYFFHKTGHHKLERVVSMVNISGSAVAVTFGLTHR